ncbi:helix-turn-helix domain-containing protein [Luteimonas sp. RIT-PG2_3]
MDTFQKNLSFLLGSAQTQARVAEAIGKNQSAVSKWSRGETKEPEFRSMAKLARVLGVSLDDLAYRDLEEQGPSAAANATASHSVGIEYANMDQAVELLYMMAAFRPGDARFHRISWHSIQVAAKAIARAEGSQTDAVRMILEEIAEGV